MGNIEKVNQEKDNLLSIFEGLDEVVYVADPNTHELLYFNGAFKRRFGGSVGDSCFGVLQGLGEPCNFCSNDEIFGENFGKTHIWEFQNSINHRWYRCVDKGILWSEGKQVRFEMAIDITDLKNAEKKTFYLSISQTKSKAF